MKTEKPSVVANDCNSSTWETEAEQKFEAHLGDQRPSGERRKPQVKCVLSRALPCQGPEASEPWEQAEPSSGLRANVGIQK